MEKESSELLITRLRKEKSVKCSKCRKGILVPYNTTYDKAHCYECSNKNCTNRCYVEGVISLE